MTHAEPTADYSSEAQTRTITVDADDIVTVTRTNWRQGADVAFLVVDDDDCAEREDDHFGDGIDGDILRVQSDNNLYVADDRIDEVIDMLVDEHGLDIEGRSTDGEPEQALVEEVAEEVEEARYLADTTFVEGIGSGVLRRGVLDNEPVDVEVVGDVERQDVKADNVGDALKDRL